MLAIKKYNITGTIISYYFHCKRRCWLFSHKINLEDNSEDVHIGKAIHEEKENNKNTEIVIDNVKIDKITKDYVVEIKKSDSDSEATKWQLLFYIKKLKDKGIGKKGKIEYIENNKQNNKIEYIELTPKTEEELNKVIADILRLVNSDNIPNVNIKKECKKCAYYEYCIL